MSGVLKRSIEGYDQIPDHLIRGSVFEVGARYGEGQLGSRHRERFIEKSRDGSYYGIDVIPVPEECLLNISQTDFFDMATSEKFDTILALEVMEHLSFRDWSKFINKIRDVLKPHGYLFITVPYNEPTERVSLYIDSFDAESFGGHVTFGITPDVIRLWLQGAKCRIKRHRVHWREEGENHLRAVARFVKRVVTRHPYAWGWTGLKASTLIVMWQKVEI